MSYFAPIERPSVHTSSAQARPRQFEDRRFVALIIALVIAAAALRAAGIGSRALWLDEAYSEWFSALSWPVLWQQVPTYEPHPPFYYSLLKLWRTVAGDGNGALRALSALASVATVPIMALAGRELGRLTGSPRPLVIAGIAAALAAFSPRFLLIAQEARPYPLLVLAYSASILAWLRLARAFQGQKPGLGADWGLLGFSTACLLWLHGLGLLYACALLLALAISAVRNRVTPAAWRRAAVTIALVAIIYLPCLIMIASRTGDWGNGWLDWEPAQFPVVFGILYGLFSFGETVTPLIALVFVPVLIGLGARSLFRSNQRNSLWGLSLLLLLPPLAAAAVSQLLMPAFLPRTLVGVLVPAYLLVAVGIAAMPPRSRLYCGTALAAVFAVNAGYTLARPAQEPWGEIASLLKREMKPGDVIWAYPNDIALPLSRALARSHSIQPIPAPYPALEAEGERRTGSPAVVTIDGRLARGWAAAHRPLPGATVWLVQGAPIHDRGGEVEEALKDGFRVDMRRSYPAARIQALHPR